MSGDSSPDQYKVILIAGNEDFLQGNLPFTKACSAAKQRGVIVNTIFCGDRMEGIREHWNLGAECGQGSFTHIDSDAKVEDITTPYDEPIFKLNKHLNATYIGYGSKGEASKSKQAKDSGIISKLPESALPPALQNKSRAQVKQYIERISLERVAIQKEIAALGIKRESFIKAEKSTAMGNSTQALETEIEKIIRKQAGRYKLVLK